MNPNAAAVRSPAVSVTVRLSFTTRPSRTTSATTSYVYVKPDFKPCETNCLRLPVLRVANPLIVTFASYGTQTVSRPPFAAVLTRLVSGDAGAAAGSSEGSPCHAGNAVGSTDGMTGAASIGTAGGGWTAAGSGGIAGGG